MDYRHTEDFARRMEAAELRARQLRGDAFDALWRAIAHAVRKVFHPAHRPNQLEG